MGAVDSTLVALSQHYPDDDENDDRAEASATQFFGAVTGDKPSQQIVHFLSFLG